MKNKFIRIGNYIINKESVSRIRLQDNFIALQVNGTSGETFVHFKNKLEAKEELEKLTEIFCK